MISPYIPDETGRLVATMPSEGPCRHSSNVPCRIRCNYYRARKTGPCYPLAVVRCTTHRYSFTIYPPGHVPYGRHPILRLSTWGDQPSSEDEDGHGCVEELFKGTIFEAGLDAARGYAWHREAQGGTYKWWGTQTRTVARLIRWLGIDPTLDPDQRQKVSQGLTVTHLELTERCHDIVSNPGYRSRGLGVQAVLMKMCSGACLLERLLFAGHLAGLWGVPLMWDIHSHILRHPPLLTSFSPVGWP